MDQKIPYQEDQTIFNAAQHLISSIDKNGILIDCNNQIKRVLGYEKSELIGESIAKVMHPNYLEKAQESLNIVLTRGYLHNQEYKMIKKDGTIIDVNINSGALKNKLGEFTRTVCICEDVTDRKRTENHLKQINNIAIGRELKMVELKRKIKALEQENEELKKQRHDPNFYS
ncbi:PAS domain S-box protein [Candidatus Pacearchaeota archaeon]|nr:PAS domain S-box protein [Candidatus Pacearchaeota archaeon]